MSTFKLKTGETVTLALAKREDLPEIDVLASIIDYENGIRTWELYFNTNHEAWWVVRNSKNELIAYTIAHAMPNGVMMGFHVVVREDYQGMGVGRLLPPNKVPWIGKFNAFWHESSNAGLHRKCFKAWNK